jgi:DNA-directed RNA polymerase subunit RPC12/RpoP
MPMKKGFEEQLIQKLSYRCPYCDQPISYDQFDLKTGENEIQCRSCKKTYIKVVKPSFTEGGHRCRRH